MSLDETLFIGMRSQIPVTLPLEEILEHHADIRDAIAETGHVQRDDLASFVANTSFVYALNTYKAIGLLLPELYHESGAVVLRQLWEVSMNLHWVAVDAEARAQDFCNFTVMEYRMLLQKSGESGQIDDFDDATDRFQTRFRYQNARGRARIHSNFATTTIRDRAVELADPWERKYELVYHLTSMHAHGAPGAILNGMFQQQYSNPDVREQNSAAFIALMAIYVIVRDVQLLTLMEIIPDSSSLGKAFDAFESTMKDVTRNNMSQ